MKNIINFVKPEFEIVKPYLSNRSLIIYVMATAYLSYTFGTVSMAVSTAMMIATLVMSYPFASAQKAQRASETLSQSEEGEIVLSSVEPPLEPSLELPDEPPVEPLDEPPIELSVVLPLEPPLDSQNLVAHDRIRTIRRRFAFTACFDAIAIASAFGCVFFVDTITMFSSSPNMVATGNVAGIILSAEVFFFLQALQLPLLFKLGYSRAKLAVFIPAILLIIASMGINAFTQDPDIEFLAPVVKWFGIYGSICAIAFSIALVIIVFFSYRLSCMTVSD